MSDYEDEASDIDNSDTESEHSVGEKKTPIAKSAAKSILHSKGSDDEAEDEDESVHADASDDEDDSDIGSINSSDSVFDDNPEDDDDEDREATKPKTKAQEEKDQRKKARLDKIEKKQNAQNAKDAHENEIEQLYFNGSDDSDEEDDDDMYGEEYLQKFDDSVKESILENHHRELLHHNYEEVEAMLVVVRDVLGNIIDPLHRTPGFLTKYEKARVLGERAKQINNGAKPFVKLGPEDIDGYMIASMELIAKKIPFIIRRPIMNGGFEYWRLEDLEILF